MFLSSVFYYTAQGQEKPADPGNDLTFSIYIESYYSYDFNKPSGNDRSSFIYSHNRHNEFNLNLGYIKASYSSRQVRASLALAAGTYMNANYAAEPGVLKNIYEASAGIKLSKKKNLWLDAGILPSHIGFESAVSKECWTLTRSILADNSPYFESGVKLTYTSDNEKWLASVLLLNGWQRIKRLDGNSLLSYGTQLQYKPTSAVTLNYSTFIGTDKPDSLRRWRYFHNLYGMINVSDKMGITAGLDIGFEQISKGSSRMNSWYSPVVIFRYTVNPKWALAARGEFYSDKHGVIINSGTAHGFQTSGFSANIDYMPIRQALIRLELRTFASKDDIFKRGTGFSRNNTFISSSLAVAF
ncbi:MAG: porin [Chitinophagaceae bacterium]|nr:porin [Chitinophagaceae bacterium]